MRVCLISGTLKKVDGKWVIGNDRYDNKIVMPLAEVVLLLEG